MLTLLSPSKTMDESPIHSPHTIPLFLSEAGQLVDLLRSCSRDELVELMHISDALAQSTAERMAQWTAPHTPKNAKQAIHTFTGAVYAALDAATLSDAGCDYCQGNIRILSGLYGMLRPFDLMQPYRLEMGYPLQTPAGNLYQFWRDKITTQLNSELSGRPLLNLTSLEYFKVIDKKALGSEIITPLFKDYKNSTLKVVAIYAKKARGRMARYVIDNRISTADELHNFADDGYRYDPELSSSGAPVFTRAES